jgi:hypothetical protein
MTTSKLFFIVLVQVGSQLWVVPDKVIGLRSYTDDPKNTCIATTYASECVNSDWPIAKIKAALESKKGR